MKLQYLGTAAAEGLPSLFCECEVCRRSKKAGGRNIRTRSQAIIDDRLLIDFPSDTYMHFINYDLPMSKIKNCLITHAHFDHLYPKDIGMRHRGYSHIPNKTAMTFFSDEAGYNLIDEIIKLYTMSDEEIALKKIKLYEPFEVDGYQVTALRAAHDPKSDPVVYLIEKDGKTLFYSNDTSEYPDESMEYLKNIKKPIDLVSFDCTEADGNLTYVGHMTLKRCVELRKTLFEMGVVYDKTVFVLNHFSHNGKDVMYDDFVKIAAEYNFEVSYDGMVIEI